MKTLNLQQAAAFLHVHPETLRQAARCGRIPGAKVGAHVGGQAKREPRGSHESIAGSRGEQGGWVP